MLLQVSIVHSYLLLSVTPLCGCITIHLFIHYLLDTLAVLIINMAAIKIFVQAYTWTCVFIFLGKYLAMERLGHLVGLC